jgi:hypothetical protein
LIAVLIDEWKRHVREKVSKTRAKKLENSKACGRVFLVPEIRFKCLVSSLSAF